MFLLSKYFLKAILNEIMLKKHGIKQSLYWMGSTTCHVVVIVDVLEVEVVAVAEMSHVPLLKSFDLFVVIR